MEIIPLPKSELQNALDLVWQLFREFEAPDYSAEGISSFKDFIFYDDIKQKVDKKELIFWGCMIDGHLAGVITLRDISHICLLFVQKEFQRKGIAKNFFWRQSITSKLTDENARLP